MSEPVFVTRCRICAKEIETAWGPETHYESEMAMRAHIEHHSFTELQAFALRRHFAHPERRATSGGVVCQP